MNNKIRDAEILFLSQRSSKARSVYLESVTAERKEELLIVQSEIELMLAV